jgi:hypothetical protein
VNGTSLLIVIPGGGYRLIASLLARQKRDIQLNLCQYGMAVVSHGLPALFLR